MENRPNNIILHHSATADGPTVSWGAIRRFHVVECAWGAIGYHYGIELVGDYYEVLIGRLPYEQGAHTRGQNASALGICFVGNFDATPVPDAQWQKGLWLCRSLISLFGIKRGAIYGHRDFANKSCPGKLFDLERFRAEI